MGEVCKNHQACCNLKTDMAPMGPAMHLLEGIAHHMMCDAGMITNQCGSNDEDMKLYASTARKAMLEFNEEMSFAPGW